MGRAAALVLALSVLIFLIDVQKKVRWTYFFEVFGKRSTANKAPTVKRPARSTVNSNITGTKAGTASTVGETQP